MVFKMRLILLSLPLLLRVAAGELPPEPVAHLTPPPSQPLVKETRNKTSTTSQDLESQVQEARALVWAAPAIPPLSSHRGRTSDCNPCDNAPWVPVARSLHMPQYALSIPAIQLTLPFSYGIPVAQMRPQNQYKTPQNAPSFSYQNYGAPPAVPSQKYNPDPSASSQNFGPAPSAPSQSYGSHSAIPPQKYGPPTSSPSQKFGFPPYQNYGIPPSAPSQRYGPPPSAPSSNYGSVPSAPSQNYGHPPTALSQKFATPPPKIASSSSNEFKLPPSGHDEGDPKTSASTPSQQEPLDDEKYGLPPPPLPQRFVSPTYGPPQPQTQLVSATNLNPTETKALSHPTPFTHNFQLMPFFKYGPLFDPTQSQNQNNQKYLFLHNNMRAPNQYRDESGKRPVMGQNPVPFPTTTNMQSPTLYSYQHFNDGKQDNLHPYLQPPKAQNVIVTITETEDSCKICKAQSELRDSQPAPAEHVTESIAKIKDQVNVKPPHQQVSSVQVVKSVPLAEYLSSVEYPMQVIQAPILDVPELSKYFDLGYHNFPQIKNLQANLKPDQITSQTYGQPIQQSPHYFDANFPRPNSVSSEKATTSALDDVILPNYQDQTKNSIPHNHKLTNNALLNHQTTQRESTNTQTTPFSTTPTTKPSQILHISKARPSSQTEVVKQSTDTLSSITTSGHYVTSKPFTSTNAASSTSSTPISEPAHSPSQNYPSTVTTAGRSPAGTSYMKPIENSATRDWAYGRVRGNNTPQPFGMVTSSPQKPRFLVRPTPNTTKKAKHIHQIIVPYTTNKQTSVVPDSAGLGWTPLPPTNQGRKVPPNLIFGDHLSPSIGSDQLQNPHNSFLFGGSPTGPNVPSSSASTDTSEPQHIFPTANGQPLNLPPQVINHILHLNQQGSFWPSGPEGLQQLLETNLQGLLRGEEDSVDITRLQKNIDKWTAEGYKQNSPSANFVPVTAMPHIFNSKKIPDEYLTSTEATFTNSSHNYPRHSLDFDHEFAESQKLQIKVHPLAHIKDQEQSQDSSASIESLLNSWSLLDTKMTMKPTPTTEEPTSSTEPTSKAWEKTQVSISPLTNEKVYVVTPVPVIEESSTMSQSMHIE